MKLETGFEDMRTEHLQGRRKREPRQRGKDERSMFAKQEFFV